MLLFWGHNIDRSLFEGTRICSNKVKTVAQINSVVRGWPFLNLTSKNPNGEGKNPYMEMIDVRSIFLYNRIQLVKLSTCRPYIGTCQLNESRATQTWTRFFDFDMMGLLPSMSMGFVIFCSGCIEWDYYFCQTPTADSWFVEYFGGTLGRVWLYGVLATQRKYFWNGSGQLLRL